MRRSVYFPVSLNHALNRTARRERLKRYFHESYNRKVVGSTPIKLTL